MGLTMRKWVKLYTKILIDPEMHGLADSTFRVCVNLIALAGILDTDGALGSTADIAFHLRLPTNVAQEHLAELSKYSITFQKKGVWKLKNWERLQAKPPSASREEVLSRVKKHRENKPKSIISNDASNVVTPSLHLERNAPRGEENRVDKKRTEENRGEAPTAAAPRVRSPDLLFDAISEVCQADPATAGPQIGKVKAALLKANPPYTPEEVRQFGVEWWAWADRSAPPTVWALKERIGSVRGGRPSDNGAKPNEPKGYAGIREYVRKRGLDVGGKSGD